MSKLDSVAKPSVMVTLRCFTDAELLWQHAKIWHVGVNDTNVAPRSEDPKLIIRVITGNFELVQPICPRYVNVTDRRTDGRTDGLIIAISRFAKI